MGAADASDLITIVHRDDHDLFRRGLADTLSTADDKPIATSLHLSEAALKLSGDESLVTHDVGVQIYMIMREAFANARQHSGCEGLEASLEIHPGRLVGTVRDDGDGFDADAATSDASGDDHRTGIGLRSIRERAEMVGEELNLTSHPGDSTTMEIRVPLED